MSSIRKAVGVMLAAMVSFGLLALPASAGVETGTITIPFGQAIVGDRIDTDRIPNDGQCQPSGKGLHSPGFGDGPIQTKQRDKTFGFQVNKEVFYRLDIPAPGGQPVEVAIVDTNDLANSGLYQGELDVCGIVSPGPAGIGAACGSSTGREGKGRLRAFRAGSLDRFYAIQNVAWPPAVAGKLLVYGHITRVDPTLKQTKFTSKGTFQGVVFAQGAAPCLNAKPGSATAYTLVGTVVSSALGKEPKPRPTKLKKDNTGNDG